MTLIDDERARSETPGVRAAWMKKTGVPSLVTHPDVVTLRQQPAILSALHRANLTSVRWGPPQIALRWPDEPQFVPTPHLDGVREAGNGVWVPWIQSFTVLLGIALTDTTPPDSGRFVVWPDTLERYRIWFQERGRRALFEGQPRCPVGDPVDVPLEPGDAFLAPYRLGHAAGWNGSDRMRATVFFRGRLPDVRWRPYRRLCEEVDWVPRAPV